MTPTKLMNPRVFLILALIAGIMLPMSLTAGGSGTITNADGTAMRAGYVVVRLTSSQAALSKEPQLPEGLSYHSRFLQPDQTSIYGQRLLAKTSSALSRLHRLEDRLVRTVVARYAGPFHPEQMAALVMKDPAIEFAEPWYEGELHATPNDPLIGDQEALVTMRMAQAWDIETGNGDVVIAISDNGVDQTHEDLKNSLWINTGEIPGNNIDDDENGFVDDYNGYNFTYEEDGTAPGNTSNNRNDGHGTKVAGIAGATTDNGLGIAGVAWGCKIFPIKTARVDFGGIIYGYQSLIYAAHMGFDIVNTSWGIVKPYSPVDQDVVDYCLELGTLIVASAGNHGDGVGGLGWQLLNFPSAYDGVLGVGETSSNDRVVQTSGLGQNATVMAPGNRAITTVSGGGYSSSGVNGTSFASPMAAGVAALVKAKYPGLTPRQIAAQIRREADNIDPANPAYATVLSGRVNGERALGTVPLSAPGLRISAVTLRFPDGRIADTYRQGDTLDITYELTNDLGLADEVAGDLSVAKNNDWSVQILTSSHSIGAIPTGGTALIGPYRVVINGDNPRPCIFELRVVTNDGYEDRLLDYLMPSSVMATFENDQLVYSVGSDGTFGYNNSLVSRQGLGFAWKTGHNLISPSGFLFSEGASRALKAYNNLTNISDFSVEKYFSAPERERSVMTDEGSGKDIGVRVSQRVTFPSQFIPSTIITVTIENRGDSPLTDIAGGYFFDWDIGYAGQNNSTRLAPEALPVTFREIGAAQAFERDDVPVSVVCAAVSNDVNVTGQAAGMMLWDIVGDADGLTDPDVITLLNSGTTIQTSDVGDACGVVGVKFGGTLAPGDKRTMMVVIGVGYTTEEASQIVLNTIENQNSVQELSPTSFSVAPQPATDVVTIVHDASTTRLQIVDMQGAVVQSRDVTGAESTMLNVNNLSSGAYRIVIQTPNGFVSQPLMVVR